MNRESLLKVWLESNPTARSPYVINGNPPMWKTLELDGKTLFTCPATTQTKDADYMPYYKTDGVAYQWQDGSGNWSGQGCNSTFDFFERKFSEV